MDFRIKVNPIHQHVRSDQPLAWRKHGHIITDADRPNLPGPNLSPTPGGNHPLTGAPLSGGANRKWDSSRQIKAKILNPNGLPNSAFAQPAPVAVAAFPLSDIVGNDDRTPNEETNDPYTNGGRLTGTDSPGMGIANSAGAYGNTWERRLHFREFARVSKGAYARFDANAAAELAALLRAVAAYATGGRKALQLQQSRGAQLLLEGATFQIRPLARSRAILGVTRRVEAWSRRRPVIQPSAPASARRSGRTLRTSQQRRRSSRDR